MGFLFWIKERIVNSFPKVSGHLSRKWLSRNRKLFEQFPKPSPGLRARLSQRESGVKRLNSVLHLLVLPCGCFYQPHLFPSHLCQHLGFD
jgi:hypothetical protein